LEEREARGKHVAEMIQKQIAWCELQVHEIME
jgi:hypothetical protein